MVGLEDEQVATGIEIDQGAVRRHGTSTGGR